MEAREGNGATAVTTGNHYPPTPPPAAAAPAPAPATHETSNPAPVGTPLGSAAPQVTSSLTASLSLVAVGPALDVGPAPAGSATVPGSASGVMKKKRGRPRKYAPDGTVLTPTPSGEHRAAAAVVAALRQGRGRPGGYVSKHQHQQQPLQIEFESLGEMVACSAGANFTPHFITVPAGEDVTMKIISFSQQEPRAVCILSANGVISNATLRQSDSSGGTLTYEGRFELLSLSGSFMPTENGGPRSRTGGMSVSLASPDGRVVGGAVAGLLVAYSPVQVVVGSFLPSYQMEQKTKKQRVDTATISATAAIPPSVTETATGQMQPMRATPTPETS